MEKSKVRHKTVLMKKTTSWEYEWFSCSVPEKQRRWPSSTRKDRRWTNLIECKKSGRDQTLPVRRKSITKEISKSCMRKPIFLTITVLSSYLQKEIKKLLLVLVWLCRVCSLSTMILTTMQHVTFCNRTSSNPTGCRRYAFATAMTTTCDQPEGRGCWSYYDMISYEWEWSIRVMFRIFGSLAVHVLFSPSFINKFIKSMFSAMRNIVPFNSMPVRIVTGHETESWKTK